MDEERGVTAISTQVSIHWPPRNRSENHKMTTLHTLRHFWVKFRELAYSGNYRQIKKQTSIHTKLATSMVYEKGLALAKAGAPQKVCFRRRRPSLVFGKTFRCLLVRLLDTYVPLGEAQAQPPCCTAPWTDGTLSRKPDPTAVTYRSEPR